MKKLLFAFMLAALTMSLSAVIGFAQSTAGVTGTVKDSNGAVIAGAEFISQFAEVQFRWRQIA